MKINKRKNNRAKSFKKEVVLSSVSLHDQIANLTRCINDCNLEIQDLRKKNIDLLNKIADLSSRLVQIDIAQRKKDQTNSPSLPDLYREIQKIRENEKYPRNENWWKQYPFTPEQGDIICCGRKTCR